MTFYKDGVNYNLSVDETAEEFMVSSDWIRTLSRRGKLPHIKVGNRFFYNRGLVEEYFVGNGTRTAGVTAFPSGEAPKPHVVDPRTIDVRGL